MGQFAAIFDPIIVAGIRYKYLEKKLEIISVLDADYRVYFNR